VRNRRPPVKICKTDRSTVKVREVASAPVPKESKFAANISGAGPSESEEPAAVNSAAAGTQYTCFTSTRSSSTKDRSRQHSSSRYSKYVHTYMCIYMYIHICIYIYTYIHICIYMSMCVCVCVYISAASGTQFNCFTSTKDQKN
jgi:hypothetical protein